MKYRVLQGGSYLNVNWYLLPSYREGDEHEIRRRYYGFRLIVRRKP